MGSTSLDFLNLTTAGFYSAGRSARIGCFFTSGPFEAPALETDDEIPDDEIPEEDTPEAAGADGGGELRTGSLRTGCERSSHLPKIILPAVVCKTDVT